jgi:hypothetical protein
MLMKSSTTLVWCHVNLSRFKIQDNSNSFTSLSQLEWLQFYLSICVRALLRDVFDF